MLRNPQGDKNHASHVMPIWNDLRGGVLSCYERAYSVGPSHIPRSRMERLICREMFVAELHVTL